jgi:two-component system nitrate/nitrite response regulator NarL
MLAEPDPAVCKSWRLILAPTAGFALVGEAAAISDVRRACARLCPDVLILSTHLLDSSKITWELGRLVGGQATIRVLLSATEIGLDVLRAAVVGGATGCVLQRESSEAMALAVRTVACGATWFSHPLLYRLLGLAAKSETSVLKPGTNPRFTKREREVLRLLASGLSNKTMARDLAVAERTVEFHVTNILRKLTLASRLEAVIWAMENGLPGPDG